MSCSTFWNGFVREAYPAIGTGLSGVILMAANPAFQCPSAALAQNTAKQEAATKLAKANLIQCRWSRQNPRRGIRNKYGMAQAIRPSRLRQTISGWPGRASYCLCAVGWIMGETRFAEHRMREDRDLQNEFLKTISARGIRLLKN